MQKLWTISELSDELAVTARAIRFYEDKGLLSPQRVGSNRVYSVMDRARLQLILRGKRLGFSLTEIKRFIELYDMKVDPEQQEQLGYLLTLTQKHISDLRTQQAELNTMISELLAIEAQCLTHLENKPSANKSA